MRNPLISLVIPTRERCDTLEFSLQTALNQKSENYEIVISDNFSQDDTKKIVDSFDDPRINYFNTGKRMSMCENWDFACERARGEFIIIIGDDDGVLPGAIDFLETFIKEHPADSYFWDKHIYTWPNKEKKAEINYTAVRKKHFSVDLGKMARDSIRWGVNDVSQLPTVYHAAVSKNILNKIKETTGKVFHSVNPDIVTSFTLPVFSNKTIHVGRCVTAHGKSPKSNGGGGKEASKRFLKEFGVYKWHRTLNADGPPQIYYIVDSALVAMELFPEFYKNTSFNYSAMWAMWRKKSERNMVDIIKCRHEIRKYHPFNVIDFIFYWFAYFVLRAYRKLIERKSRIVKRKISQANRPNNILEFVNLVAEV